MCVGTKRIYIIVRFTDRMRIVIVCEVVSVLQFHLCETRRQKKKPRNEIIANSSHRMAIFSLSVVISFSFVPPLPRRGDVYREN